MAARADVFFALLVGLAFQVRPSVQDCARPTNLQSNVVISPDQPSYGTWYAYVASCDAGYDLAGPTTFYCYAGSPDYWSPDPSLTVCTGNTELVCDSTSMTLIMARSLLDVGDDGGDVHFNDESCVGYTHDADHVAITTPFDQCSTIQNQTEDYIVYSNKVTYYEPRPEGSGDNEVITREHYLHIPVSCNMKREEVLGESFVPKTGEVVSSEVGYGEFSLSLERYSDSSYTALADDSAQVFLGTPLYFGVNLTTNSDLSLFLDTCWATPSAYPLGGSNYTMLSNGCPLDDTMYFRNYFGETFKGFQVDAFAFIGDYPAVYVHCSVLICDSNDPSSRCARGCVTRARRSNEPHQPNVSGSRSKPHTISNGPLTAGGTAASMNRVAGNHNNGNDLTFDPMTVVAVVSLVAFIALLIATVLMSVRRMHTPTYQLLTSDHEEMERAGSLK